MANLGEMHGQLANATANATAAQADAAAAHASQNASAAALASASTHADAAQSNASSAFLTAVVSIALGAGAIGLSLVRRGGAQGSPKKSFAQRGGGGGGGGSGGSFGINEQGVKRGEVATGDLDGDGREAFARGPRQTTSLDDSFDRNLGLDSHQIQARQGESGLSVERQTPKADFGDRMKAGLETASGVTGEASAPPDVSSGMPTEKRQHGKNWVVDDTGDEGLTQRDQAPGMATGKRQHGPGPVIKAVDAEGIGSQGQDGGSRGPRQTTSLDGSYAPDAGRDAASGQATGKRQHGPGPVIKAVDDEGIGSQGQDGVSRDVKTPRDAASGQASGKMAAPRDSATGQASGKRVAGGDLDGDRFVDRDAASGQASGKRESATGQASGQRETATGKATGRTAAPGDPGSGSPSGLAIGDQGAVEGTPPKKKPPK